MERELFREVHPVATPEEPLVELLKVGPFELVAPNLVVVHLERGLLVGVGRTGVDAQQGGLQERLLGGGGRGKREPLVVLQEVHLVGVEYPMGVEHLVVLQEEHPMGVGHQVEVEHLVVLPVEHQVGGGQVTADSRKEDELERTDHLRCGNEGRETVYVGTCSNLESYTLPITPYQVHVVLVR